MGETPFFLCFRFFLPINNLTRLGIGIYEIHQSYGSYKVLNTYVFFAYLFAIFEILSGYPEF